MEAIAEFLGKNAPVVIATFALSFAANIIQVLSFFRDQRRLKDEREESQRLQKLVDTYGYVMDLAQRNIKTDEQLRIAEDDIRARQTTAKAISERIDQIQLAAKHQLVASAIERRLKDIADAYSDVVELRKQKSDLGTLPDLPDSQKKQIELEIVEATRMPFELPKSFTFRALLLVLLVFLLPWPISAVLTLAFLHIFLATFFEAAVLYADSDVQAWTQKYANLIGVGSAIGLWNILLHAIESNMLSPALNFLAIGSLWGVTQFAIVSTSIILGILHWRGIRARTLAFLSPHSSSHAAQ